MMHAYIRHRFEVLGGYSSGFFDEFPDFFGEINSPSAWEINTHEAMTNRRLFLPMVFAQRNHNARLGVQSATLMTWGGLQYTDAFQDLDEDTANDVGLNDMASRCQPATGDTNDYRFNPC